ncbi:hypothetical protein [Nocardioides sp. Root151]|uniref:hypothetical protein n=1 Tax=Nocardioides sp. Root151 TaxID=1736475 RepID=UPI0007035BAD|nr:hypothetical protein [Nocardioides sp. Root151]KQZ68641.1 hypothetical protein ASD66_15250 [Nocardioides sp. Root151]
MDALTMMVFMLGVLFVNILTYGLVTWVYFKDKNKPLPVKAFGAEVPGHAGPRVEEPARRADKAA